MIAINTGNSAEKVGGESSSDNAGTIVLSQNQSVERDEQAASQQQITDPDQRSQPKVFGDEEYSWPRSFDHALLQDIHREPVLVHMPCVVGGCGK